MEYTFKKFKVILLIKFMVRKARRSKKLSKKREKKEKIIVESSVEEKRDLLRHWLIYVAVSSFVTIVDLMDKELSWSYWVWLGWGFALTLSTINKLLKKESTTKKIVKKLKSKK